MTSKSTAFNNISVSFYPPSDADRKLTVPVPPKESFLEVFLSFSCDVKLRQMMLATDNKSMKLSRLLEMLDSMAGDVAMKHTRTERTENGSFDIALVTACVSGLSSCSRMNIMKNYSLQGYVSFVGTSAMEVTIEVIQDPLTEDEQSLSKIYFTMVALDPTTNKARPVPQLLLESKHEKDLFEAGKNRSRLKKMKSKDSLTIKGPRNDESQLIHQLYLDSVKLKEQMNEYHRRQQQQQREIWKEGDIVCSLPLAKLPLEPPNKNIRWVKHTKHTSSLLMHSQNMNVNGKIFGGYIMRKSFDAAHLSASLFYGTGNIHFSYVDDIQFVRPVHVGSVIEFVTHVAYSRQGYCVTHCNCYELDIVTNIRTLTNVLHYVFNVSGAAGANEPPEEKEYVEVIPREYNEILAYLEGKRTLDRVLGGRASSEE